MGQSGVCGISATSLTVATNCFQLADSASAKRRGWILSAALRREFPLKIAASPDVAMSKGVEKMSRGSPPRDGICFPTSLNNATACVTSPGGLVAPACSPIVANNAQRPSASSDWDGEDSKILLSLQWDTNSHNRSAASSPAEATIVCRDQESDFNSNANSASVEVLMVGEGAKTCHVWIA